MPFDRLTRKYGNLATMKATLELPDPLFRKAKATASERGQSLKEFVSDALRDKLASTAAAPARPNRGGCRVLAS